MFGWTLLQTMHFSDSGNSSFELSDMDSANANAFLGFLAGFDEDIPLVLGLGEVDFLEICFVLGLYLSVCSFILESISSSVIALPDTTLLKVFLGFLAAVTFSKILPHFSSKNFSASAVESSVFVVIVHVGGFANDNEGATW